MYTNILVLYMFKFNDYIKYYHIFDVYIVLVFLKLCIKIYPVSDYINIINFVDV